MITLDATANPQTKTTVSEESKPAIGINNSKRHPDLIHHPDEAQFTFDKALAFLRSSIVAETIVNSDETRDYDYDETYRRAVTAYEAATQCSTPKANLIQNILEPLLFDEGKRIKIENTAIGAIYQETVHHAVASHYNELSALNSR